jgi:hypothetical protein
MVVIGCGQANRDSNFEKVLSFDRNLTETRDPEEVCILSEDSVLLNVIQDIVFITDTEFIVADGVGAYLYDTSGVFKKQFGHQGRAAGEMLSPARVYATSDLVYVWCSSLMKIVTFDHDGHFQKEFTDFDRAVKAFVVDPKGEMLHLYTSGQFDKSGNNVIDVINSYRFANRSSQKHGERGKEDEISSAWNDSGGISAEEGRLTYIHPGNLIIYDKDLNSSKVERYKIEDKAFRRENVSEDLVMFMNDRQKAFDFLTSNSVARRLYKDDNRFVLVAEIGEMDFNTQQHDIENQENRKIKLYVFDSSFNPDRTILYDFINSPHIVVNSGAMYFLSLDVENENQTITLNRYPLMP